MVERSHFLSQQPLDVLRLALQASDVSRELLNLPLITSMVMSALLSDVLHLLELSSPMVAVT